MKEGEMMKSHAPLSPGMERRFRQSEKIQTTLSHLIEVISEEVRPEEEYLVAQTVLDLIDKGWLKFPALAQR